MSARHKMSLEDNLRQTFNGGISANFRRILRNLTKSFGNSLKFEDDFSLIRFEFLIDSFPAVQTPKFGS